MKLRKLIQLLLIFSFSMMATIVVRNPLIPKVHAVPMEPLSGDAWTENDNTTITWTWIGHQEKIEFTSEFAYTGSYSVRINHTSAWTRIRWIMDFVAPDTKNSSEWDVLVFYIRPDFADGTLKTIQVQLCTDVRNTFRAYIRPPNRLWTKCVIPPLAVDEIGNPNITNIDYLQFYVQNDVTPQDYSCIYIDGLHFQDFENPDVDNPPDITFLPNVGAFISHYGEQPNTIYNGSSYTSLYDFTYTNGTPNEGTLECESLAQTVYAYATAYLETGATEALAKASLYGDFLKEFPESNPYGCPPYTYRKKTETFHDQTSIIVAGWVLAGLSKLYATNNDGAIKKSAELVRHFICDVMWNPSTNRSYQGFTISSGTASGEARVGMGLGAVIVGLSAYYRHINQNKTVREKIVRCYDLSVAGSYGKYGFGTAEGTSYTGAGLYEATKALENTTFWERFSGRTNILNSVAMITNGTYWQWSTKYWSDNTWDLAWGWANAQEILYLALLYKNTLNARAKTLWQNLVWDWYKGNRQEPQGGIYFHTGNSKRMWLPSMAFIYAGIAIMQDLEKADPYPIWISEPNITFFASNSTYFTTNLTVANGCNVTVQFYMPKSEDLWDCFNCSETSWDYSVTLSILTVWVVSDGSVTLVWKCARIPGDVNGDGTVDIFDALVVKHAYWSKPGDPNWVPEADINQDGVINSGDAVLLISHYGQTT